jgi:hypothetical protein
MGVSGFEVQIYKIFKGKTSPLDLSINYKAREV